MISKNYSLIFFYYVLITYLIQICFFKLGFYNGIWKAYDNYYVIIYELIIVYILSVIFYKNNILYLLFKFSSKFFRFLYFLIVKNKNFFIFLSFIFAIFYQLNNYGSYRYLGDSASSSLSFVFVMSILLRLPLIILIMSEFYFKKNESSRLFYLNKKNKTFILFALLLTITGVTSAIVFMASVFILFVYKKYNLVFLIPPTIALIFLMLVLAYSVKWNKELSIDFIPLFVTTIFSSNYLNYLIARLSITFYSHSYLVNDFQSIFNIAEVFPIQFNNFIYRLNILAGDLFEISKPAYQSINRFNYESIANFEINERSGTSPGLIPSFQYAFGKFLGLLFSSIYIGFIFKILSKHGRASILLLCFNILFFQSIFKSPLQVLIIVDNSVLSFLGFLVLHSAFELKTNNLK